MHLGKIVPEGQEPLNGITGSYINIRYGEHQLEEKEQTTPMPFWGRLLNILIELEDK